VSLFRWLDVSSLVTSLAVSSVAVLSLLMLENVVSGAVDLLGHCGPVQLLVLQLLMLELLPLHGGHGGEGESHGL